MRFGGQILPAWFTGDFGSGVETDILYVPLIFSAASERQELHVTVPYLSLRTDEPVTFVGGDLIPRGARGRTTEAGLGDVVVKEEIFFVTADGRGRPWVSGFVRLKLPTADESKGLGTGELDYGAGAAIIQPVGASASLLGEAQYVVRGDPPGTDLRNTWWLSAGAQWRLTRGSSLSFFLDTRQSVIRGRENLTDLSLGYDLRLGSAVTFRSSLYRGLSDTAEDYGVSLGVGVRGGG